jgi:hypothetical protein
MKLSLALLTLVGSAAAARPSLTVSAYLNIIALFSNFHFIELPISMYQKIHLRCIFSWALLLGC